MISESGGGLLRVAECSPCYRMNFLTPDSMLSFAASAVVWIKIVIPPQTASAFFF